MSADYASWKYSGSLYILTTPEGADLPAAAVIEGFPLLVRLHKDFFDFGQANANGDDLRLSSAAGQPLTYQVEEWDAAKGIASVWVRIPKIQGNARQEIKVHWGKADAKSESDGKAVFNESNGYVGVWHMGETIRDEVGALPSVDTGTTATAGIIGKARHFPGKKGIFCGDKIPNYPTGSSSHSTEAWFRAEKPNGRVIAWGNEHAQGKVVMHYRSPPHVNMECYFSDGNVSSRSVLASIEWVHVVHTYQRGESRVYVNGKLDGESKSTAAPLSIKSPARLFMGGWYHVYDFVGDIDEVRVSRVVRSPEWIRLEYDNQKPLQTLVGHLVQPGAEFSVSESTVVVAEGKSATLTAKAGGAQRVYWVVKRDGRETVAATDRFSYALAAGRVVGDQSFSLQFRAVYPNEVKSLDIPVTVKENIPEPLFTLSVPAAWDGRQTMEIVPHVTNLDEMRARNADKLNLVWSVSGLAVIKEALPGKLVLKRAQNSGTLTVAVAIDNGGAATTRSATIAVKEPATDAWVEQAPARDEKPEEGQFYARNDKNEGTLFYNGTLTEPANSVFLKLYADDKLFDTLRQNPGVDKSYAFSVKLKPGLIKYKVEFGAKVGAAEVVQQTVSNLVCGDVYLIQGQSNAEATGVGKIDPPYTSDWIRSYGSAAGDPNGARLKRWGLAVVRDSKGRKAQLGAWGMDLAKRLVENQQMPICILNGAVGGTRIDEHQRNPADPTDAKTIYGRLLWRVREARLTHGVRAVLWHQGESDQGADGPSGGYGWESYQQSFFDLASAWKEDYPNIRHYYTFQIWPRACAMGINGSDNRLREVQRKLPAQFSNLRIMSTLGIKPADGCHFPTAGYAEFARLIGPLVERDQYGETPAASITAADLQRVYFTGAKKDEVVMEFDQPMKWDNALVSQFYLDGEKGKVLSGSVKGNVVRLKLTAASVARSLTYLDSRSWSQDKLLYGENGIAALTFCEVAILPRKP